MNQRRSRKTKRKQQPGYTPPRPSRRPKEPPQPNVFFVALIAIAGGLGLLSVFGVGYLLHDIRLIVSKETLVRTLPDVRQVAPGVTAILDGRVAASEPARYKEFVAYIRERERGGVGRSLRWTEVIDQAKPLIEVEAGSRTYKLANETYAFDRLLGNWTDAVRIDEGPTMTRNAITIQGIVTQSPVTAVGRLVSVGGGEIGFHADSIVALSRADYAERLENQRHFNWSFAGVLAVLGPLLIYLCWKGVRRVMGW